MATTQEFIKYVVEQIDTVFPIRYRKMFGDYMVYINEKPLLLVCDNIVYIKILPEIEHLMVGREKGYPYNGAKIHYILDMDDQEHANQIIKTLESITPLPKIKK
jgi:TfoX/Sxy family transcriptional regulator of competence genes